MPSGEEGATQDPILSTSALTSRLCSCLPPWGPKKPTIQCSSNSALPHILPAPLPTLDQSCAGAGRSRPSPNQTVERIDNGLSADLRMCEVRERHVSVGEPWKPSHAPTSHPPFSDLNLTHLPKSPGAFGSLRLASDFASDRPVLT